MTSTSFEGSKFFDSRIGETESQEWLSSFEAAKFLSVTPNALRIMVYRDQVKAYKLGVRLRFRKSDCLALFQLKGA
jgi:hypothetical protein